MTVHGPSDQTELPKPPSRWARVVVATLLCLLGVWWYYSVVPETTALNPLLLGLDLLGAVVLTGFLVIRLLKGFTAAAMLLLALPSVVCIVLSMRLRWTAFTATLPLEAGAFREFGVLAASYLLVVVAWIAIFPLPYSAAPRHPKLNALSKRIDWAVFLLFAVMVGVLLVRVVLPTTEPTIPTRVLLLQRTIQFLALVAYIFFLLKISLRVEIAETR